MAKTQAETVTNIDVTGGTIVVAGKPPTLHQRLLAAWEEASYVHRDAAPLDKAGEPKFTAASYDALVGKLRPVLGKHRILAYPDAETFKAEVSSNGEHTTVFVTVGMRFVNADDTSDFIVVPGICVQTSTRYTPSEHVSGSVITYALKNALRHALLLKTGDDPDLEARPSVDMPPEIQLKIENIRFLVAKLPGVQDIEAHIRDKLIGLCEKYSHARVRSIEGLAEPVLDAWLGQLERQVEEITGKPTKISCGIDEANAPESSDSTPAAEPKAKTGDADDHGNITEIPPRDRGAKIVAWLSLQRPDLPQGDIRNAFGGWRYHAKYDAKLNDDTKWAEIWGRREEILVNLDERQTVKA